MSTSSSVRAQLRRAVELLSPTSLEPQKDASLLLCRVLGKDRAWLLSHADAPLTTSQITRYHAWLVRRQRHEPIQYILGEQEFYGLSLAVTPDVLIPRPETEHLVEAALARIPLDQPINIADIGTGSGAIAVALACHRPLAFITALDTSQAALQIAEGNASTHSVAHRIRFLHSDLLAAVTGQRFDMIISNPPYVPESEALEAQVRDWEPAAALYAGPLGLAVYERLIPQAERALSPGGWMLLEIGHGQREALASMLGTWRDVEFIDDLQGIPRVVLARWSNSCIPRDKCP